MHENVAQAGEYDENYLQIFLLEYLRWLCGCCCKDLDWFKRMVSKLERHEKAVEILTEELDIVKQIKGDRVTDFLVKISLKRYQRALVANF